MKKDKFLARRVYVLITVMGLWGAAIGARLYFLHVVHSGDFKARAVRQQQRTLDVSPRRGNIYDRKGRELASSIKVDSVFAVPDEIESPEAAAKTLSRLTGVPHKELQRKLETDRSFVWIKRKIKDSEAEAIRKADLAGIYFQQEDKRFYPKRELAAHVLGYVNIDQEGLGGLEYRYNEDVRGEPGRVVVMTDGRRQRYDSVEAPSTPGADLVTTIDENIQFIVEKELQAAADRTRAKHISIVAMDPRNGEVLAMASHPPFNPNEYARYHPSTWNNRGVSQVYEPGSTFKIVTAMAALEENLTTPDERIDCQMGSITIFGHRIRDHKPFGVLSVTEILHKSSDVGIIKLGMRLGDARFAEYIKKMGFGKPTGIDLPGEEKGLFKPASRWSRVSVGAISMGQEIGTTPLQILSMVSSVANGGVLFRPFVVKKVVHPTTGVISETSPDGERVMSTETAIKLQGMLEGVVTDGSAKPGRLDGYRAAGKTGTAQKIDETGRYSRTKHIASFAGYAPASNPVISIIVVVDEPIGLYNGGTVAAPIFKKITEQVLRYMAIPPDEPEYAPQYTIKDASRAVVPPVAVGAVYDRFQSLIPASYGTESEAEVPGGIEMPDFHGKSLRQVTEDCLKLGLRVQSVGSGAAVQQNPPPGASVRAGSRVQVRFSTRLGGD